MLLCADNALLMSSITKQLPHCDTLCQHSLQEIGNLHQDIFRLPETFQADQKTDHEYRQLLCTEHSPEQHSAQLKLLI